MSGSDVQFNIAKGFIGTYFNNVDTGSPANSAIILVPLEATGLVADATLIDYDDLSALLAGASNEQTSNFSRKSLVGASVTLTLDDSSDYWSVTIATQTWTAVTGNAVAKLLVCYDGDTTGGTDANIIPLLAYSFDITPDGSDVQVAAHANGLIRITT